MLQFTGKGIYCPQADVYIDPVRPVPNAIITHGHSDHARPGMERYLCHTFTESILKCRLGDNIRVETLAYGNTITINNVKITLFPAGHIIGSAQVRLDYEGEVWVVSGDYKLSNDGLTDPFEPVKCHHFITESTFGLPVYKFPPPSQVYREINDWWKKNAEEGYRSVLLGYSLGKAQSVLKHLDTSAGDIFLHTAVASINKALAADGFVFPGEPVKDKAGDISPGAIIIAPPSVLDSAWMKSFQPYRVAMCSGWMQLRGARRRMGIDKGFVLSDHCDWDQLNTAIELCGAEDIYVTHGYEQPLARWLQEEQGLQAHTVRSFYEGAEMED